MNPATNTALVNRIAEEYAASVGALPAQIISRERRRQAMDAFSAQGVPATRDENWRYANLHTLEHARFAPSSAADTATFTVEQLPAAIKGYARYVFVDGRFVAELSQPLPAHGITISSHLKSNAALIDKATAPLMLADTRLALLNEAFATDSAHIVASESAQSMCVELVFVASAKAGTAASYPRVTVQAQPQTRIGLIERHISLGSEENFVNAAVEVDVARGATVDHYRLQQTGRETTWMDTLSARVATDAAYRLHLANLGAQSARSTLQIALQGERAAVVLNAVSVPHRMQVHDVLAVIEHAAPNTTTEQRFRGIAAEQARVGFSGKMVVRENAARSVSRQSLRGLLAGPHAEVDVRPQLEIYTDDVQCSHGATAGKLDDNMLFYLLSRGLEQETANLLLKWAFLEDVVAKIDLPELRRQIEQTLAGQMDDTAALKEML